MKRFWKRACSLLLTGAMLISLVPATAFAAPTADLLADFSFDNETFGFTGGSAQATGTYTLTDSFDSENGKALYLNGSTQFLSVTDTDGNSLLTGKEEITISYDAKPDRTATSWVFYAAPNANRQGAPEYYIGAFINNNVTKVERYKNGRTLAIEENTTSDWAHVDIVFAKNTTTVFVNGIKKQSVSNSNAQLTDILGDSSIFQIGKANWGNGEYFRGWIDNFKIYDEALTDEELIDEDAVQKVLEDDKEALTLPEEAAEDFTLPSKGANGSSITWNVSASEYAVIGTDGYSVDITRADDENKKVTFTATITLGGLSTTKEIDVIVKRNMDDADVVADALKLLTIENSDDVRGNVTLPTELSIPGTDKLVSVSWKSSNTSVVTDTEKDGMEAGVVTRKDKDVNVTMTAAVTCGTQSGKKDIELHIVAKPEEIELTDYLFAFFVNNGGAAEQQIFFAAGHDGNNWMDLNKKEAVLSVADSVRTEEDLQKTQNQAGVRDPYLIRSPEGDKFYMIATDLCIGGENIAAGTVGWGTAQFNGSLCLRIWESTDLVNWSEPWLAEVAPEGTTCAWAPEAIYDDVTGQYVVYWASMTGSVQKVYYSLTRDFKTFTEPQMFIDNGADHIIDTTIVKTIDGNYYRGSAANSTIRVEKCNDTSEWLSDQSVWEVQGYIRELAGFSPSLEGPELFMYNEDDWKEVDGEKVPTYGLYADNFGSRGYIPFYTTDIENAEWAQTADNDYNFDTLHKRHGTIIGLTAEEYDRVMEAYGPSSIAVKSLPTKTTYTTSDTKINGAGLVLTVTYKNGKTEDIAYPTSGKNARHFTFSGVDFEKEGTQAVTVAYGEQTTTFNIAVGEGEVKPPAQKTILAQFDFDDENTGFVSENAKAAGSYELAESWSKDAGQALSLDGTNFLSVTDKDGNSLLTGSTQLTVSFEMKVANTATNWSFYAAPNANAQSYNQSEHYIGVLLKNGTLTLERYDQNGSRPGVASTGVEAGKWARIDIVMTEDNTLIYVNGVLKDEESSTHALDTLLGENSIIQIGKANWGNGEFYNGLIDNMTIWNYALTEAEVAEAAADFVSTLPMVNGALVGTAPTSSEASDYRGTDDHTAITTLVDAENKILTPYVRNCADADVTKLPVTIGLNGDADITVDGEAFENGSELDLSEDVTVVVKNAYGREETWTIKAAVTANNPVLPGQYADPDIDYFDGKFWIFPTTDGFSGWSGTVFHAWSSEDMVNWTDEGIILDVANDDPGVNEQGVEICASKWAVGSAWAPSIEEKDGKYYFYYCGKFNNGESAIGVAVADDPAGPYTDLGEALFTRSMATSLGLSLGQAIDPSIFTDDDGTSYLLLGNGSGRGIICELGEDMMSVVDGTIAQINGLRDFRESVVVMKVDGKYHWTWSCDDTGSPNYHVNYGVSDSLYGEITFVKTLLAKNEDQNMLGTAHQSMLHIKDVYGEDRYFIAYHRFYTPLDIYTSGLGYHRETCIDEVTFDENGYMVVEPTLEGIDEVHMTLGLPYVDVSEDDWFYDAVEYTYFANLMTGMDETHFGPYSQLSRAQFALILYRMAGEPEVKTDKTFADITGDEWYGQAVLWAADAKVVNGYENGCFGPADNITREQMAVMMFRYAAYLEKDTANAGNLSKFTDGESVSPFATDALKWAADKGIITGKGTEEPKAIDPQGETARCEAAAIIQRYMESYK